MYICIYIYILYIVSYMLFDISGFQTGLPKLMVNKTQDWPTTSTC